MPAALRALVSQSESAIIVRHGDTSIALDPSHPVKSDLTFVSHAHTDHLHRKGKDRSGKIITSRETSVIARARGYDLEGSAESHDGVQLVETGHILGSRGLLLEDSLFYTGDISTRERAFMKPAKMPRVRTLIIESTFGRPGYVFPPVSETLDKTNRIISETYDSGRPVVLMGYALGKAQLLTSLFRHWEPLIVHDSVAEMNSVYSELGVNLDNAVTFSQAEKQGLLKSRPWLMVAPLMSRKSQFVTHVKDKYGAVTVGFSGWAADSSYRYMMGLDYAMPMSDHCDYEELVAAVKECAPEEVYTFHGFAKEFAHSLGRMGFKASAVGEAAASDEVSLDSFQ